MSNKPPRRGPILLLGKPRPKIVRNRATGRILPCLYRDCWDPGSDDIRITTPSLSEPGVLVIKIFCSQIHRELYIRENTQHDQ